MKKLFLNVLIQLLINWLNFIVYNMFMTMNSKENSANGGTLNIPETQANEQAEDRANEQPG